MTNAATSMLSEQYSNKRNIHDFSPDERSALMRELFEKENGEFQAIFGAGTELMEFDCAEHSIALRDGLYQHLTDQKIIQGTEPFNALHETLGDEMRAYTFDDGVNTISKACYDMPASFQSTYIDYIREVLYKEIFKQPFWFQQTPTLRIHCPNGNNSHHYPRYHTDIGYGHPPGEINIWLPLTEAKAPQQHGFRVSNMENTRNILREFNYDFRSFIDKAVNDKAYNQLLNDVAPQMTTSFGSMIAFDSRLIHTGEPLEQHTRASMDIRIILCDDFERDHVLYQGSGRRKVIFAPGQCYDARSSDQL